MITAAAGYWQCIVNNAHNDDICKHNKWRCSEGLDAQNTNLVTIMALSHLFSS